MMSPDKRVFPAEGKSGDTEVSRVGRLRLAAIFFKDKRAISQGCYRPVDSSYVGHMSDS